MKVLVVQPRGVVDVVLSLPAISRLKQRRPQWSVHFLLPAGAVPIVENEPMIDAIYTIGDGGEVRLRRLLAAENYDVAIMLGYDRPLAALLRRAGIRKRIGFLSHWSTMLTLNHWVWPRRRGRHESDYLQDLVEQLIDGEVDSLAPRIHLNAGQRDLGRDFRENEGSGAEQIVFIHPGNGRSGLGWDSSRFARLANVLAEKNGWRVFLIGGKIEREMMGELAGRVHSRVRVLMESHELREWLGLLTGGDLLIGADDAPLYLASALGVPTLGLFAPLPGGSVTRRGPRGSMARFLMPDVPCPARATCFLSKCRHWNCFEKLDVETVVAVAGEMLAGPSRAR